MQLRLFTIRMKLSFIESIHTRGITTTLAYPPPSHAIQKYHNIIIPLKQLWTLPHFIHVHHFILLLARHRIHYHVHTITNTLHSLRDGATLKNEVAIHDVIPFCVTRRTGHSLPTRGDDRKLHSSLIPCSRYYHSAWTNALYSCQSSSNCNDQNPTHFYSETMQSSSSNEYSIIHSVREQFRLRRDNDT